MTHGISQVTHGMDHLMIHLEMHFSELVHLLPHCDLLTLHLQTQTLMFWRRNDNDRSALHRQTCPCARAHPNASLARILALCLLLMTCITQTAQLTNTHKPYANHQYGGEAHTDRLTFHDTLLAAVDGGTISQGVVDHN